MSTEHATNPVLTPYLPNFQDVLKNAVESVVNVLATPDKEGGYFCLISTTHFLRDPPILVERVGYIGTSAKAERNWNLCQEKARRLARHPEHRLSWESRNEAADQWGGAITVGEHILSFSGLTEPTDEAVVVIVALILEIMTLEEAEAVAGRDDHRILRELLLDYK